MKERTMRNRIISLVAIAATVLVVLLSNMFLSANATHHCHDEAHCPVCSMIVQCENNIKTIGSGLLMAVVAAMILYVAVQVSSNYKYQSVQTTLVSQKVRLDS